MKLLEPLAYLSTDPVNAAAAEALAAKYDIDLELVEPRDLPRLVREQIALVLDWDFLPPGYRDELLTNSGANVVAVHGYNLGDGIAGFLPRRGILCGPRLDADFFQALAADSVRTVAPEAPAHAVAPVAETA